MKYTEAWAEVVSQNFNLKVATTILGSLAVVLGLTTLKLTFKDSIIIERGCYSKVLNKVKDEHSKEEVEAYLREALSQRFDSLVTPVDGLLSPDELKLRITEQHEFEQRSMKQRIIINSVTENAGEIKVDSDRVISANDVRSAFRFPLTVKLESKARSYSNPYGLLLVTVKQVDEKEDTKKESK